MPCAAMHDAREDAYAQMQGTRKPSRAAVSEEVLVRVCMVIGKLDLRRFGKVLAKWNIFDDILFASVMLIVCLLRWLDVAHKRIRVGVPPQAHKCVPWVGIKAT